MDERGIRRVRSRLYHRMKSGISRNRDSRLRHLVLTSSNESIEKDFNYNKDRLVQEIRRLTIKKLVDGGYVERSKVKRYYGDYDLSRKLAFEYISCRTSEGVSGVWHIAFFGDYVPQRWISEKWDLYHHAPNVSITDHGIPKSINRLLGYFLTHYFVHQDGIKHLSWSQGWLKRGMVTKWKGMIKRYGIVKAILLWEWMMNNKLDELPPGQLNLDYEKAQCPNWVKGALRVNRRFDL